MPSRYMSMNAYLGPTSMKQFSGYPKKTVSSWLDSFDLYPASMPLIHYSLCTDRSGHKEL